MVDNLVMMKVTRHRQRPGANFPFVINPVKVSQNESEPPRDNMHINIHFSWKRQ